MRTQSVVVVMIWAGWSALCVSTIAYIGAGAPDSSTSLLAGAVGGVVGAVAGAAAAWYWGERGGSLIIGLLFGVLLAIGYSLWRG